MATFGKYEVVTELHSGERGSVFSARAAGGGREIKYAVKTFNPRSLDLDEQFWESQAFTERARVQQRVAEPNGAHWAPVYETGTSPAGTYYVTDFHPLSAASLVSGRVDVSAGVLYSIVRSVVAGLSELKAVAGRAHGNLKATNVLINSRGDVAVAGAVLTDPASAPDAAKAGEAGDLYALGGLIHLLVLGERFPGGGAWPLQPAREWAKLGVRQGRLWRRLCNDLLSPDPAARPPLDALAKRVRRLVPKRVRPSRRLSLAVAAAVIVVAAGAAAVLGVRDAGARREVCVAKQQWAGAVTAALADPRRRALFESDPDLVRVVRELDEADLASFDCDGPAGRFGFNPNLRQFRQTQDTLDAVRRAERGLSPIQWRQLARAAELQGRFEARGWKRPAQHLADCIAGARTGSADLAGGIERFLTVLAAVDKGLPEVEEQWVAFQTRVRELDDTRDPVMKAFAAFLRNAAATSVELGDAGFGSLAAVDDASLRARNLVAAHRELRERYDEDRFKAEVVSTIPLAAVQSTHIDRYLEGMAAYRVKEAEIAAAVAELRAQAQENEKLVRDSGIEEDTRQAKDFERQLQQVDFYIKNFASQRFIESDFVARTFADEKEKARTQIALLKGFVRMEDVEKWLANLESPRLTSNQLGAYWNDWKENLATTAAHFAGQREQLAQLRLDTRRLGEVLVALDDAVAGESAAGDPALADAVLKKAAAAKREEVMASLIKTRPPIELARQPGQVDEVGENEAVKAAAASLAQWTRDLAELAKDFPVRQRILTPDVRPDEKWAAAKPAFWNDRIVQTFVEADVVRLRRLRALETKPRPDLLRAAQSERVAEVALHAWRLLGKAGEPAWPTRPGELATEAAVRRRLLDALAQFTPQENAQAVAEVNAEGPRRWRRFAEAAGADEAMLASALELRGAMNVAPEQFAALPAESRFNLSLLDVRRRATEGSEAALVPVVRQLTQAAKDLSDRTVAADLAKRLASVEEKEPFSGVATGDAFTLQPQGAESVAITFRRVKPAGRRPVFLATTELSVAQLSGVLDAAAAWDDLRSLVWFPQPGDIGDPRRGPRSWEWVMRPAPRMYPPQWWMFPEDANDFPGEFRDPSVGKFNRTVLSEATGGNPSERHPAQYLTPEAAMYLASLVGCRLPTAAEWRAAYEGSEKAVPAAEWNLRDGAWQAQWRHVAAALAEGAAGNNAPQSPDEGIYLPPDAKPAGAAAARALPHRDGTVFFRPVDAAGGGTFRHLVGNVAEFVCDASGPFEQLKDRRPQRVKEFAAGAAAGLFVIGGSALSPPDVPTNTPLPVKPGAAYSDVGFRLAFTAPSKNLAEKLEWALAGQGFVQPNGANKTASADKSPPQS